MDKMTIAAFQSGIVGFIDIAIRESGQYDGAIFFIEYISIADIATLTNPGSNYKVCHYLRERKEAGE